MRRNNELRILSQAIGVACLCYSSCVVAYIDGDDDNDDDDDDDNDNNNNNKILIYLHANLTA
jgi:hypothetical protein